MTTTVTKTVKSAGGDFSSLSAWEAARQADLTVADTIEQAECYTFLDTSPFTIDGWTTDATRYIRIYTPTAERHTAIPATGYRLESNGFVVGLTIIEDFVRLEGVAFHGGSNNAGAVRFGNSVNVKDIRISHCYFDRSVNWGAVVFDAGANAVYRFWNNIINDNVPSVSFHVDLASGTLYCHNNTVAYIGGSTSAGFTAHYRNNGGTFIAKNNISYGKNLTNFTCYSGSYDAASTNNLSSDGTAPGSNAKINKTPLFVDGANDNFKLASTDADCKNQGADLSADANLAVTDDIVGSARPQVGAFDIGAFEILAGPYQQPRTVSPFIVNLLHDPSGFPNEVKSIKAWW